jgi:hypothetical protein
VSGFGGATAASSAQPAAPDGIGEASVEQLLQAPPSGDWAVRRLRGNPAVLVIEFPSLQAQGQALNRIAALLEKGGGHRQRVLSDGELQALMRASGDNAASFYLGHDYDSEGLARFYSLAQQQGVALNGAESRLRELVLRAGLLARAAAASEAAAAYRSARAGALVSFSALQADDPGTAPDESMDRLRRESVLRHELSHGEFFTNAAYRDHCWRFWRELMSETERTVWRRYLGGLGYDTGNEELMVNETQALLMHTPDGRDFNATALGLSEAQLEGLRARFALGWRQ